MTLPQDLARECRALSRYLAGVEPTPSITSAYARGHARMPAAGPGAADAVDRLLLDAALAHPLLTRPADGYARLTRPTGLLRQKLVLLCAILESGPPAHGWFDTARTGSPALALARVLLTGLGSLTALAAGTAIFAVPHLFLIAAGRTRRPGPA